MFSMSIFMLDWLHSCHFNSRLTYSDLCLRIPDSKFRQCLLRTLAVLFDLMCSYHEIMEFQLERKVNFRFLLNIFFPFIMPFLPSALCIQIMWTCTPQTKLRRLLLGQSWLLIFNYLFLQWLEKSFVVFHPIA